MAKTKIIIEEIFTTENLEKRKEIFEEIFINIIRKSEIHKSI